MYQAIKAFLGTTGTEIKYSMVGKKGNESDISILYNIVERIMVHCILH